MTFLVTGNLRATATQTGVNERTLSDWVKADWWEPLLQTLHYEKGRELDSKLSQIIDRALDEVADRLVNGDHKIGRNGNLVRVPILAKEAAIVAAVMFDKRQIIRNLPTAITQDKDHLSRLAAQLIADLRTDTPGGGG